MGGPAPRQRLREQGWLIENPLTVTQTISAYQDFIGRSAMDFGIAKAVSAAGGPETLTQTGMMIGTPAYVSPEQAAGANCAAVLYRPEASMAIALVTALSTRSGIELRNERTGFGISVKRFAITAWGVAPLNGRSPVSISYSTHPRLY